MSNMDVYEEMVAELYTKLGINDGLPILALVQVIDGALEDPIAGPRLRAIVEAQNQGLPFPADEKVNHPEHYNACGEKDGEGSVAFEPIKVIEAWGYSVGFCFGNALKYILRSPYKGTEREDIEKALWYLKRLGDYAVRGITLHSPRCQPAHVTQVWNLDEDLTTAVFNICASNAPAAAEAVEKRLQKLREE